LDVADFFLEGGEALAGSDGSGIVRTYVQGREHGVKFATPRARNGVLGRGFDRQRERARGQESKSENRPLTTASQSKTE
uniref:Uncharacterized protein n=1 Tax=Plectus sambesii TaxID=2011161 RepID=A0A914VRM1_9BILA